MLDKITSILDDNLFLLNIITLCKIMDYLAF